jgi:hypothetical protein
VLDVAGAEREPASGEGRVTFSIARRQTQRLTQGGSETTLPQITPGTAVAIASPCGQSPQAATGRRGRACKLLFGDR